MHQNSYEICCNLYLVETHIVESSGQILWADFLFFYFYFYNFKFCNCILKNWNHSNIKYKLFNNFIVATWIDSDEFFFVEQGLIYVHLWNMMTFVYPTSFQQCPRRNAIGNLIRVALSLDLTRSCVCLPWALKLRMVAEIISSPWNQFNAHLGLQKFCNWIVKLSMIKCVPQHEIRWSQICSISYQSE